MDMDQRTRFLGGRAGRIILLGDGTEILTGQVHDDDGDVDMEDRITEEAEDADFDAQVQKDIDARGPNGEYLDAERNKREETPSPALQGKNTEPEEKVEDAKRQQAESGETEPKMMAATDSAVPETATEDKDKK